MFLLKYANQNRKFYVIHRNSFVTRIENFSIPTAIRSQWKHYFKSVLVQQASYASKVDTSFNNPEEAFRSKSFAELIRGYFTFTLCSSKLLVKNTDYLLKSGEKILGRKLFNTFMKMTVFGHFVGGEDKEELLVTLRKLRKYGVKSLVDYAVEEDISGDAAVQREMTASTSKSIEKPDQATLEELGGKLEQFKPSKEFADRRKNVDSARTYFYENEEKCDRNADIFTDCIRTVAVEGGEFIAIKLTALGRPQLLLQLSEIIMRARSFASQITGNSGQVISQNLIMEELEKNLKKAGIEDTQNFLKSLTHDKQGVIHIFPWYGIINENKEVDESFRIPSKTKKTMVTLMSKLPDDEKEMFKNMIKRLNKIISVADESNVSIMVDAEQTYFQPAISRITVEMMNRYNKKRPIIFNTYQGYLKQTFAEVSSDVEQAHRQQFYFGFKLVRGAYMLQERERAKTLGYPDPVNESYDKTTEMLYKIIDFVFKTIKNNKEKNDVKRFKFVIASHNEDTIRYVLKKMEESKITVQDDVVGFAQLYGMSDYITFTLGQAGYSCYKYTPYGPVHEVLPYLSRRAKENISVLAKLNKEKRLREKEILRRILKGQIFNKP